MTETIRVIVELLTKECEPSVTSRTEALADWYKMASTIYLQTEILYKDLADFQVKKEISFQSVETIKPFKLIN
jgi:TANK-binding kinase 1